MEITLVTDAFMRRQNLKFRGIRGTTDVLSFPQIPVKPKQRGHPKVFGGEFLGDILISLDQARRQAEAQGIPLIREVTFLTVHSVLHLIGYDHATEKERAQMQKRESRIWELLYK